MRLKRSECPQCLDLIQNEPEQGELFRVDPPEDSWHVTPLGDMCQRPSPFIQVLAFIEARYALEADLAAGFPPGAGVPLGELADIIRVIRASSAATRAWRVTA